MKHKSFVPSLLVAILFFVHLSVQYDIKGGGYNSGGSYSSSFSSSSASASAFSSSFSSGGLDDNLNKAAAKTSTFAQASASAGGASTGANSQSGSSSGAHGDGNTGVSAGLGNAGVSANAASQAVSGNHGSSGSQGFSGGQAASGNTGFGAIQGSSGGHGVTGNHGHVGGQGFAGNQGLSGSYVVLGGQGLAGGQRVPGSYGPTGSSGLSGSQGYYGNNGIPGKQGLAGSQAHSASQAVSGNSRIPSGNQGVSDGNNLPDTKGPIGSNSGIGGHAGSSADSGANTIIDVPETSVTSGGYSPYTNNKGSSFGSGYLSGSNRPTISYGQVTNPGYHQHGSALSGHSPSSSLSGANASKNPNLDGNAPTKTDCCKGPFPGPSGSIHDYKLAPKGPTTTSPEIINHNKYTGPFPGPSGSIHTSKPSFTGSGTNTATGSSSSSTTGSYYGSNSYGTSGVRNGSFNTVSNLGYSTSRSPGLIHSGQPTSPSPISGGPIHVIGGSQSNGAFGKKPWYTSGPVGTDSLEHNFPSTSPAPISGGLIHVTPGLQSNTAHIGGSGYFPGDFSNGRKPESTAGQPGIGSLVHSTPFTSPTPSSGGLIQASSGSQSNAGQTNYNTGIEWNSPSGKQPELVPGRPASGTGSLSVPHTSTTSYVGSSGTASGGDRFSGSSNNNYGPGHGKKPTSDSDGVPCCKGPFPGPNGSIHSYVPANSESGSTAHSNVNSGSSTANNNLVNSNGHPTSGAGYGLIRPGITSIIQPNQPAGNNKNGGSLVFSSANSGAESDKGKFTNSQNVDRTGVPNKNVATGNVVIQKPVGYQTSEDDNTYGNSQTSHGVGSQVTGSISTSFGSQIPNQGSGSSYNYPSSVGVTSSKPSQVVGSTSASAGGQVSNQGPVDSSNSQNSNGFASGGVIINKPTNLASGGQYSSPGGVSSSLSGTETGYSPSGGSSGSGFATGNVFLQKPTGYQTFENEKINGNSHNSYGVGSGSPHFTGSIGSSSSGQVTNQGSAGSSNSPNSNGFATGGVIIDKPTNLASGGQYPAQGVSSGLSGIPTGSSSLSGSSGSGFATGNVVLQKPYGSQFSEGHKYGSSYGGCGGHSGSCKPGSGSYGGYHSGHGSSFGSGSYGGSHSFYGGANNSPYGSGSGLYSRTGADSSAQSGAGDTHGHGYSGLLGHLVGKHGLSGQLGSSGSFSKSSSFASSSSSSSGYSSSNSKSYSGTFHL